MPSHVCEILTDLISQPSVNPRLTVANDPNAGESRVTAWLCDFFARQQWPWLAQQVEPGRDNVVALLRGRPDRVLLWEAHQDTVAVAGMKEPFAAAQRQGRIYGRGACDVKGGLAAMLAAAVAAVDAPPDRRPTLILASTVNEECGFSGARALAELLTSEPPDADPATTTSGPLPLDELRAARPHGAIIAEPTDLQVVAAHRGVVRWQARTHGRAVHSSRPDEGANAVYAMARVVLAIEELHRELDAAAGLDDPLLQQCGRPTVSVTTISGGVGANTVPDAAVIDIDRRISPGESPESAFQQLQDELHRRVDLGACRLTHDPPWMQSTPLADAPSRRWADRLLTVIRTAGVASELVGVPYGTNAATLAAAGIPAAVFGPGSIEQAHTIDEFVEISQLDAATAVLTQIARGDLDLMRVSGDVRSSM